MSDRKFTAAVVVAAAVEIFARSVAYNAGEQAPRGYEFLCPTP
jgi:hypothetical protein